MLIKPLNPNLFLFLKNLDSNNNRNWFLENKRTFKSLETEVKHFKQIIVDNLNSHDKIEKAKIFRIYRDIRFSKNKTPFKTHIGLSYKRKKPALRGG